MQQLTESKTAEIEKNKNDALTQVKQTCGKLKFTLKGSVARDQEFLQMALKASQDRLISLESCCEKADQAMLNAVQDDIEVNVSDNFCVTSVYNHFNIFLSFPLLKLYKT